LLPGELGEDGGLESAEPALALREQLADRDSGDPLHLRIEVEEAVAEAVGDDRAAGALSAPQEGGEVAARRDHIFGAALRRRWRTSAADPRPVLREYNSRRADLPASDRIRRLRLPRLAGAAGP